MRMAILALITVLAAPAFGHVTVAPQQSPSGATQVYKMRAITWTIAVPVWEVRRARFQRHNPASGSQLNWNVTETFADGSTIEFTDKPGAKEKSSVTKLTSTSAPATPAK